MILVMFGAAYGQLGGFVGTVTCPEGQLFQVGDSLRGTGALSFQPAAALDRVYVNDFNIEYYPNGKVKQFTSDLSVVNPQGCDALPLGSPRGG